MYVLVLDTLSTVLLKKAENSDCYHRLVILEFILLSVQIWTLVKTQVRGQFIGIRIGIVDNSNPQNSVTSSSSHTNERLASTSAT